VTFVDTSALYALLDRDDACHAEAAYVWRSLLQRDARLVTTNYVVVESVALVQRRLGLEAVRTLLDDVLPVVHVVWVDERLHDAGCTALLAAARPQVSLVDWTSFEFMRRNGLRNAFAFDDDFWALGFEPAKA
jgi:predicted nucleic acid-binding protein